MKQKRPDDSLEVFLDAAFVGGLTRIGTLSHDRGVVRFQYVDEWLKRQDAIAIDPELTLDASTFFPEANRSNFGVFLDSSPDRWGQKLIERRERLVALDEKRPPRKLYAWDFLLGVQDVTRMGALRFRRPGSQTFLDDHALPAPPVTQLAELEGIAADMASNRQEPKQDQLRRWLSVLVAPGASLGGARPKANFREADGSLWIAKFPSADDVRDHAQWELLSHELALQAGIHCPPARVRRFNNKFSTFCVRRFDRADDSRVFFASAMSLLRKDDGDEGSYLDLVGFLRDTADEGALASDLEQLYRRVVFNAMIGNCDDHLRNHGFILDGRGWHLAPAYDMNPSTSGEHVLDFDGHTKTPSVDLLIETAPYYDLDPTQAERIVAEIAHVVQGWETRAAHLGIERADIELTRAAFSIANTVGVREEEVAIDSPRQ